MLFEKDVGKVLREYDPFFSYAYTLEYDRTFRKNRIVLHITRKDPDQFVVNDMNLKIIGNFIKELWSLKYFKRIEFQDLFETNFIPLNTGWSYKLMRYLKSEKSIYCNDKKMVVFGKSY
jgi:hypothetical protein